jgi:RNA polymerase sigma factor (sigma-70 family)
LSGSRLVEHFFRREYGALVATLSRRVGVQHLDVVEDAAQTALATALLSWPARGEPQNPSAWLFRVAHNALMDALRKDARRRRRLAEERALDGEAEQGPAEVLMAGEVPDALLRMLFVCCDEAIPVESRLALALKTLCGFDVREIALRLFTSEANVYKRLARARRRLREVPIDLDVASPDEVAARLPAVLRVLYLLFTEGHLSTHLETPLRRELCDEAIRLCTVLAEHPAGQKPETFALLALMHLHAARGAARECAAGGLLLLEEQDRALWDQDQISTGMAFLARSATGSVFSRYHAEAGVAAEHCLAPSLGETRWERIVECYAVLERDWPSPLHTLNRAVAVAEWKGPTAGLAVLDRLHPPPWLAGSYLWSAVLADLHRRAGHREALVRHRDEALAAAPTDAVRALLRRRLSDDGVDA